MSSHQPLVGGGVNYLLRLEGFTMFVFTLMSYEFLQFDWGQFVLLFFLPDLAIAAYIAGPRAGAICYNTTHTYILPLMLFAYGFFRNSPEVESWAIVWMSHIGFDRTLGYGLKYSKGFRYTHLRRLGHSSTESNASH